MPHLPKPITTLLQSPKGRYLVVGGSVYVFEVAVIILAQRAGASPVVAVSIGFWFGLVVSFTLQKLFTFGDKRTHHKVLLPQLAAVTALVIWNFGFTVLVTKLLSNTVPPAITRTIALAITTIWNFYLYNTKIFATSETQPETV